MTSGQTPNAKRDGKLTVPDKATQREVLQLYHQVERLKRRQSEKPPIDTTVQPQDKDSGLVRREWVRKSGKGGEMTERTLVGERVKAAWMDQEGQIQHAAGKVIRNESGELAVESQADGIRKETTVPRDSMVIRKDGVNLRP
ncbi:hypothetical protein [Paludisphaera borealis]|uniref:Uncharacterized protein n=1 Tax=Paludisphaera borealis TaxID=1387353 RepID=A0A1U7CI86_9BACT|nr:hypothetical protein [Paludisphaera borealis]APW58616.1 hypothetical protein BSF38_00014 [Paludisphaera borealis]